LIRTLSEGGCEVLFVTRAKPRELERHTDLLEAEGRVSCAAGSDGVQRGKPASDIFDGSLCRTGATPEEVAAVGDSIWDIETAKATNVRTVAVLTGGAYSEGELREVGVGAVLRDCAELLDSGFPRWLEGSAGGG
jgi:phosphoglycolate phosphatase-like HAD superfamily hydrolase